MADQSFRQSTFPAHRAAAIETDHVGIVWKSLIFQSTPAKIRREKRHNAPRLIEVLKLRKSETELTIHRFDEARAKPRSQSFAVVEEQQDASPTIKLQPLSSFSESAEI